MQSAERSYELLSKLPKCLSHEHMQKSVYQTATVFVLEQILILTFFRAVAS